MGIRLAGGALALVLALLPPAPSGAQSAAVRTPNLGAWTAAPGVVQFNFLHRFELSGAPLRKLINTPTFLVATGLGSRVDAGFIYGSNSTLVPAYPNEWEFFARAMPLLQERGAPLDLGARVAWNVASESLDAEMAAARALGPLRLLAAGRWFGSAYADSEPRTALAGGALLHLTPWLALAGDYAVLLDRADDEPAAWGAGVHLGVPYTPHSLSLHASNVGTASLEGSSRGTRTRWGFEYTVPITLRRYAPGVAAAAPPPPEEDLAPDPGMARPTASGAGDTVHVTIEGLKYVAATLEVAPGTTVVWTNRDPVVHTVTADDGAVDSGVLAPGASWSWTFAAEGTVSYHCTPHPFMNGTVVVRDPAVGGER